MPMDATCHCGQSRVVLAFEPEAVTDCNCSICRRYGVLWAYYDQADVDLSGLGPTDTYEWDDRSITFHRCAECGCVTDWWPVDPNRKRVGVNARLLPLEFLERIRIRHLDGAVTERYLDE